MTPSLNDWQTMHTRKELEEIRKRTSKPDTVNYALLIEIFLLLLGFGLNQAFEVRTISKVIVGITCLALAVTIIAFVVYIVFQKKKKDISAQVKDVKDVVDLIDNRLCYYLMTAENMASAGIGLESDIERFYLIETCYYLNKCTMILMQVDNNLYASIFCCENKTEYTSGKISIARLSNIFALIDKMYFDVSEKMKTAENMTEKVKKIEKNIRNENAYFQDRFNEIKGKVEVEFPEWI